MDQPRDGECMHLLIHLDRETASNCGAEGTFQVISIEDETGIDYTKVIDQGFHYSSIEEIVADLAAAKKWDASNITFEEV